MKRLIVFALVGSLLMAGAFGCAETDRGKTQQEGTAAGAAGGAVLGAVLGAIIGGDAEGALVGAAIGATVGGVAGYAYGTHVADKKAEYAAKEDWLNACIASLEETNAQTKAYNAQLEQDIVDLKAETTSLQAKYEQNKVKKDSLLAEKKVVDEKLAEAQEKLGLAKWEVENQEKVLAEAEAGGNTTQAAQLDQRIQVLKAEIAKLEKQTEELADMSSRMAV